MIYISSQFCPHVHCFSQNWPVTQRYSLYVRMKRTIQYYKLPRRHKNIREREVTYFQDIFWTDVERSRREPSIWLGMMKFLENFLADPQFSYFSRSLKWHLTWCQGIFSRDQFLTEFNDLDSETCLCARNIYIWNEQCCWGTIHMAGLVKWY